MEERSKYELGQAPTREGCVFLDDRNYYEKMVIEATEFIRLIKKECYIPQGVEIRLDNLYDGEYMVVVDYPINHPEIKVIHNLHQTLPERWGLWFRIKKWFLFLMIQLKRGKK